MKLISMTDFVLSQQEKYKSDRFYYTQFKDTVVNYATFLKQPLKLEMFVPCDDNGDVLEEQKFFYKKEALDILSGGDLGIALKINEKTNAYRKAKEKVLFEGFELEGSYLMYYGFMYAMKYELGNKTIESIIDDIPNNPLQLTPTAIKQIKQ